MVKAGSYGNIDAKSGQFQVQGNIYDLKSIDGQPLYIDEPKRSTVSGQYSGHSSGVYCNEFDHDAIQ